ncbi:MAG: RnfABCDGE type electron transport complex subunit D [Candidatus Omnitrophica bacterium]|nr:RnfABCDGE type electron transport complex subunit D [Candidatus Omnitrophota bacterium]MBU4148744.1 RnfABCDGE type electron transport complex subunit D [Candidatus Omnitrophota bacterium]
MLNNNLTVSPAPHIRSGMTTQKIMYIVICSLLPAGLAGVYIFGLSSLKVILISIIACVISEVIFLVLRNKDPKTILDGSAILTGLLLAYNLPPGVPFWIPVVGGVVSIMLGKQIFGGLGHNIFNPALVGRAFLQISWPVYMTTWKNPRWALDAVSTATPLAREGARSFTYMDLFLGNHGGCIGEVCIVLLLAGALILLFMKIISFHIPASFIGTVMLLVWIFGGNEFFQGDFLFHLLAGGLVLGAFFMATDYVTRPLTKKGKIIFGIGCGVLTVVIRLKGSYPEGVSYAILFMNAVVPLIDRHTKTKVYGAQTGKASPA